MDKKILWQALEYFRRLLYAVGIAIFCRTCIVRFSTRREKAAAASLTMIVTIERTNDARYRAVGIESQAEKRTIWNDAEQEASLRESQSAAERVA